jgi:N-acetylglucosaminyldiphosphoundecaprenol N-acetyl-beta-D-mannosaminyltransferase
MSESYIDLFGYSVFTGSPDFLPGVEGVINTINPHCYIVSLNDKTYREALENSDYIIPDGVGIQVASRILIGKNIPKIAGSDLHSEVLKSMNDKGGSCFYLGSSEDTLKKIKERLSSEHPDIRSNFFSPPFREAFSKEDNERMIKVVNDFKPDVLFIGMTAPKQEKWVYQNRDKINAPLICQLGLFLIFMQVLLKDRENSGLTWGLNGYLGY